MSSSERYRRFFKSQKVDVSKGFKKNTNHDAKRCNDTSSISNLPPKLAHKWWSHSFLGNSPPPSPAPQAELVEKLKTVQKPRFLASLGCPKFGIDFSCEVLWKLLRPAGATVKWESCDQLCPHKKHKGQENGAPKRFKQMFQCKCFQGNVAFAFVGRFPQFPEMASSLGKGHHKNQVQLVTREVPRETCAESEYSYKCFYTAALSIVLQLCSFQILHNCSIFWAWPILPRIIWFFPMVGFQPIWLKSRLRQGDFLLPPCRCVARFAASPVFRSSSKMLAAPCRAAGASRRWHEWRLGSSTSAASEGNDSPYHFYLPLQVIAHASHPCSQLTLLVIRNLADLAFGWK